MKKILYRNRNVVLVLAIVLFLAGAYMAYVFWGVEPQETYAGYLIGFGVGTLVIYSAIKNS